MLTKCWLLLKIKLEYKNSLMNKIFKYFAYSSGWMIIFGIILEKKREYEVFFWKNKYKNWIWFELKCKGIFRGISEL